MFQTKSVKIIRDREDKPKGFGYIEFEDVEGLKEAIAKSGSVTTSSVGIRQYLITLQNFAGRVIRVSVAEPRKSLFGKLVPIHV